MALCAIKTGEYGDPVSFSESIKSFVPFKPLKDITFIDLQRLSSKAWALAKRTRENQVISGSTVVHVEQLLHLGGGQKAAVDLIRAIEVLDTFGSISSRRFNLLTEILFDNKGEVVGANLKPFFFDFDCSIKAFSVIAGSTHKDMKQLFPKSVIKAPSSAFNALSHGLRCLGIKWKTQILFYRVIAGLSHLLNIEFIDPRKKEESAGIKDFGPLDAAVDLLGISANTLITLMTARTVLKPEKYTEMLDPHDAQIQRDSLVATIYSQLFFFIAESINKKLNVEGSAFSVSVIDLSGELSNDNNVFAQNTMKDHMLLYSMNSIYTSCNMEVPKVFTQRSLAANSLLCALESKDMSQLRSFPGLKRNEKKITFEHAHGKQEYQSSSFVFDPVISIDVGGEILTKKGCRNKFLASVFEESRIKSVKDGFIMNQISCFSSLVTKSLLGTISFNIDLPSPQLSQSTDDMLTLDQKNTTCSKLNYFHETMNYILKSFEHCRIWTEFCDVNQVKEIEELNLNVCVNCPVDIYDAVFPPPCISVSHMKSFIKIINDKEFVVLDEVAWLNLELSTWVEKPLKLLDPRPTFKSVQENDSKVHIASEKITSPKTATPDVERPKTETKVKPKAPKLSKVRRRWMCCTTFLTWWIPTKCLECCGMHRKDIQQTWREKVALCIFIGILSGIMLFFITGFSQILCPEVNIFTAKDMVTFAADPKKPWNQFIANGYIYDLTQFKHPEQSGFNINKYISLRGRDVSLLFPRSNPDSNSYPSECQTNGNSTLSIPASRCTVSELNGTGYCHDYGNFQNNIKFKLNNGVKVGTLAWPLDLFAEHNVPQSTFIMINKRIYDVTKFLGSNSPFSQEKINLIKSNAGKDMTQWASYLNIDCLEAIAFMGVLDDRNSVSCMAGMYILQAVTYIMVAVMVVKFLAAIRCSSVRKPEGIDKFVMMQVPCYSEGTESLKKTIDSLSLTDYDDKRKLLFVVADGMVKGAGNESSTPELVLDIFGVKGSARDTIAHSYIAIGEGSKQHNKAKVYSGLYHIQGRAIPYMVVIKCGTEKESAKAGNRGKRDSQMILMKFVNKVFYNTPLTPLELELYRHLREIIGIKPSSFEYVLMVDADTEVGPECLTRLISYCLHDSKIMGLCGETRIANEKESWITMIQVYEYYISHHLAKAFESLFGSVTCLPGCFCMYRLYSNLEGKRAPLVVSPEIIKDYSESNVDTLHKKNLLSLGEDRYLTTLLLKYFPQFKMKFTPDSFCLTIVPTSFSVLLSQRRRWINSTIHNLFELLAVDDLCGCLIFSMRLVVFLDLFATLVMPASVAYLMYLIYLIATDPTEQRLQILILVGIVYGMQAVIFLMNRQWQHIGWMIIHIIAMPVFYMFIPLYAFWHFDDFSWGNTRRVEGDSGKGGHDGDGDIFDVNSIPTTNWQERKKPQPQQDILKSATMRASPLISSVDSSPGVTPQIPIIKIPEDDEIKQKVFEFLKNANMQTTTKKIVRLELSKSLGIDLTQKRDIINAAVDEFLSQQK